MGNFMTDPVAMRDSARKFHQHADNIAADAGKAWASANDISGTGWQGNANNASLGTLEEMNRAFKKIQDMCSGVADNMNRGADTYEQQEQANQSSLSS
jgi:WXG100 family type VII secretion target